jgi:hypothetical protein
MVAAICNSFEEQARPGLPAYCEHTIETTHHRMEIRLTVGVNYDAAGSDRFGARCVIVDRRNWNLKRRSSPHGENTIAAVLGWTVNTLDALQADWQAHKEATYAAQEKYSA